MLIDIEAASVEELERAHERGWLWLREIPEYGVWHSMKRRCKPNYRQYRYYGARGIDVCPEWDRSFWCWFRHIGRRPTISGFVISQDRIDNRRGYQPGNVRWASGSEQSLNTRGCNGADNNQAKLTWAQVREIRRLRGTASSLGLARVFGVSPRTICYILSGESWIDKTYQPDDRKAFVKHMQEPQPSATGE
jgi:hypothetical protein